MTATTAFLTRPGAPGALGALMDEYARAAGDFCQVFEQVPEDLYVKERPENDGNTITIQKMGAHVILAGHRYAKYIRQARELHGEMPAPDSVKPATPAALRPFLAAAMHATEAALEGLHELPIERIEALTFRVAWGPTYDPEMLLEHAIVHLLRHRRQIERWPR